MKKVFSALFIVLVVLITINPVSAGIDSSTQLTSDEMGQITGGRIMCGDVANLYCCCFDAWIFQFCLCVG